MIFHWQFQRTKQRSVLFRNAVIRYLFFIMTVPSLVQSADVVVDYENDIKPIFKERCIACHGVLKAESGLRLDAGQLIHQGSNNGPVINIEEPLRSILLLRIQSINDLDRMPPEGQSLTPEQRALIRSWIESGALFPVGEKTEESPNSHWAFQKPNRPHLPGEVSLADQSNPIDLLLSATHAKFGLDPLPLASKEVQLRRVYIDLIGLPPTRDELKEFLEDGSENALEKIANQLLEDPRYGERWARHWMDVWRYSDWYGRRHVPDVWNSAPQIWRWRDWIVRSLNEDKGYDQMVREMLAADEICGEDQQKTVATGYLIRNWFALNPNDWMRNTVEHTGKAFLGLTFNCAHCHDHKYDPISQEDYFRFRAFFEPIGIRQDRVPGEADPGPFQEYNYSTLRKVQRLGAVTIYDKNPNAPTWFYTGGDERNRDNDRGSLTPDIPDFLKNDGELHISPVSLPLQGWSPGNNPEIQQTLIKDAQLRIEQAERRIAKLPTETPTLPEHVVARLTKAKQAYFEASNANDTSDRFSSLSGQQSLIFDATQGRRTIFHRLTSLGELSEGFEIEFQVRIMKDSHFNFQLAKHVTQGLTAAYIAFENGRILSYQPGTFTEFDVGNYDYKNDQRQFHVSLRLQLEKNVCFLTVVSQSDEKVLVADIPIALNNWNPIGDPTKGIFFDARPGSIVAVDDLVFRNPTTDSETRNQLQFNFESPSYEDGHEIVGQHGWELSSISEADGTSIVASHLPSLDLLKRKHELDSAELATQISSLQKQAATAQLMAAQADLESIKARISAEVAKQGDAPAEIIQKSYEDAIQREEQAQIKNAEFGLAQAMFHLAQAEAKPVDDANRAQELKAAQKQLKQAQAVCNSFKSRAKPEAYTPLGPVYPRISTGRRSALAAWITSRENPLTARVAVNHIWMRHFHQPLVSTVDNFGRSGAKPTHPELLDWLAVELMESNWSMKHIHRLIVTSDAYLRKSSSSNHLGNFQTDPENNLLWRMNTGRMESEVVRDSLLHLAGKLDFTQGGQELENKDAFNTYRRSLYYSTHPENGGQSAQGELFDAPDGQECYRRTRSIVPQQALALTNSETVHEMSSIITQKWEDRHSEKVAISDENILIFSRNMFEHILSREPTAAEERVCLTAFYQYVKLSEPIKDKSVATLARESLVRAFFNHNDFLTIR